MVASVLTPSLLLFSKAFTPNLKYSRLFLTKIELNPFQQVFGYSSIKILGNLPSILIRLTSCCKNKSETDS